MTTTLILIRHGETDWNRQHRFQGQIDVPLNDIGHEQARRLAARLEAEPIDVLLASDLQRAQATAAPLARARGRELLALPAWREQHFGVLEGLDVPTIQARHPELWAAWTRHDADFALPGGESSAAFAARVWQALGEAARAHAGARIAVVTHGGVLDMLWRQAQGLPLSGPRTVAIPNAGINRVRWVDDQLQIDQWADDAHLGGLPPQPGTDQRSPAQRAADTAAEAAAALQRPAGAAAQGPA